MLDNPQNITQKPRLKTIAYVIEKFPSPTEYFVLNEVLALHNKYYNLVLLILNKQNKYLSFEEIKRTELKCFYLPKRYYRYTFLYLFKYIKYLLHSNFNLRKFRNSVIAGYYFKKLDNILVDHIHAHFAFITTDIAEILADKLNVKYSFTAHANDIYTNLKKIEKKISHALFVVTCTEYNRQYINNYTNSRHSHKIHTVYHGIDLQKWYNHNSNKIFNINKIRVISVARLTEKKGLIYLLEAVKIIQKKGLHIECTIIGEGHLHKRLNKYIKENKLHHIKIIPYKTQIEIKKYLCEADIFILPSIIAKNGDRDGIPNVLVEAMAVGIPVIASNISAIPELIEDNKTGLLVRQKNPDAIAGAALKLMNNNELYCNIVKSAKENLELNFNFEKCINNLRILFEGALN